MAGVLKTIFSKSKCAYFPIRNGYDSLIRTSIYFSSQSRGFEYERTEKQKHIFPESEFQSRIQKLRSYMSANEIEASILTSLHNVAYFSGFTYCAFGRPYACVITHDMCKTVTPSVDGVQPWRRSYGENVIYTDWRRDDFYHTLKAELTNYIGNKGKVGVEFDHLTLDGKRKLETIVHSGMDMVDIGEATMNMRLFKSQAEINLTRVAASIADLGGHAAMEAVEECVPEHIVALHAETVMVKEIAKLYPESDIMTTWAWIQSGINSDGAHNPLTTRKIQKGDIFTVNMFPMIQSYYAALERTAFLHHVSDEHLRYWEINCQVHKKGLELIKPGVRCCDVVNELNEIYSKYNLLQYRTFGYGHSFGLISYYYGREAALELREDITLELQPGMIVSMEPMIAIPEGKPGAGGYREHDILVINLDGKVENITKYPYGPEHNIIRS